MNNDISISIGVVGLLMAISGLMLSLLYVWYQIYLNHGVSSVIIVIVVTGLLLYMTGLLLDKLLER